MSAAITARSQLAVALLRYSRSWGFWVLLLAALIASRFMVAREDGAAITIAIGSQLPVMTSAMVGVSLGIVISTTLMPLGFIYLRSNTNRRQPWQVEDVTAGSRIAIALGRFGADAAVFGALLVAITIAGWILAWLLIADGEFNPITVAFALWIVAAPALLVLAAIARLFDARPWLRRWPGDVLYFILWMASLLAPIAMLEGGASGFAATMTDMPGFTLPLLAGAPPGTSNIAIGASTVEPGRVAVDVMAGLTDSTYLASRALWIGIALALVMLSGLVHAPRRARAGGWRTALMARLLDPGAPPAADPMAKRAGEAWIPLAGLVWAEIRLIGGNRLFLIGAAGSAFLASIIDRHPMAPALLLLIFAATAYAGQSEAKGLTALTATTRFSPWMRRGAFFVAVLSWSVAIALPAYLLGPSNALAIEAVGGGALLAVVTIVACGISGSAFAARLLLLIGWYVLISG